MLSEVPEGWGDSKLEDVCEILDKFRVPLNSDERQVRKGNVPYWGANGIVDYIDEAIFDEPLLLMPEDGGPFGEARVKPICHKIDEPVWVNNHAHVLRVSSANREYVYQWFVNRDITDFLVGGTRAKLNQKALRALPILLPPLNEQHRIAEILSSVDASIQATQAVIEQAERVKRGLMEELLTGGLGSEAIERGEVPEGWAIIKLADLTTKIGSGVTPKGGKKAYVESGFQLIRSQNVGWGEMLLDDVAFITPEQHEKMDATKLKKDDVLLNITGASIGRSAIYKGETGAANVNQHVCILRTKEVLAAGYLNAWLLSHAGQKTIDAFQAGGNRQGLNFQQIGSFPIPLPPISEQQRIAEIISSVDELIAQHKSVIEQQARTKRGLMDDLLTGKVRTV